MTTNATVEARHKDGAAGIALMLPGHLRDWIAQALANLEAARAENADLTNRLAEIDRQLGMMSCSACDVARELASGHTPSKAPFDGFQMIREHVLGTPSPCPSCAAKDEAMAEIAEIAEMYGPGSLPCRKIAAIASRFIIQPADPVVEAIREMALTDATQDDAERLRKALASRGLEITELSRLPLGGAK